MTQFDEKRQGERLHELREREEEQLAEMLSGKYGVEYIDLTSKSIDTDALRLIPEAESRASEVAAFRKINKRVLLAMRAPDRSDAIRTIQNLERLGYAVERYIVSRGSLENAWDRYHDLSYATETEAGILTLSNEIIKQMISEMKTLNNLREQVEKNMKSKDTHRVSRILEMTMAGALSLGASDVHLEPEEENVRMRYRLDGVLIDVLTFDRPTYALISSRIKLLSGLKLNIKTPRRTGDFRLLWMKKR